VTNLFYTPRQNISNGRIARYEVYVSSDPAVWGSPVATGTFPNTAADQTVAFTPKVGRYLRLRALSEVAGRAWTSVAELNIGLAARLPQSTMTVRYVDSQETAGENGVAGNVLDGNPATIWHTQWQAASPPPPHEIQLDLGAAYTVSCVHYLPRSDSPNGRVAAYEVYTSIDGVAWGTAAVTGTWANTTAEKSACFTARAARYVRLRALSEVNGRAWTSAAELNVEGF
jgi:endo-alpha-N-acetylgalactosaminidase